MGLDERPAPHQWARHAEFKLTSNLRSPRRIAELVNRVWDLYDFIEKRDRPSGTGYADIDDDATDQMLYCTAAPGADLNLLLDNLAVREGLALIAMDDAVTQTLPESVRPSVLTPAEAKGLDFHSVCLLNAGPHLDRIVKLQTTACPLARSRASASASPSTSCASRSAVPPSA